MLCKPAQVALSHLRCHCHLTIMRARTRLCAFEFIEIKGDAFRLSPLCSEINVASSESNGLVAIAARPTVLQQAQRQRSSLSLTCQLPALQQRFKSVSVSMRSWLPILYVELKQSSSTSTSLRSWHQRRRRIKVLMQGGGWLLLIYCPWPSHLCEVGFNEKRAECVTRSSSSQRAKHASSEKSSTI